MGISGRIARAFLRSKLTPLVTLASLAVGLFAVVATPREEEPQISVPMIDVIAALPGAGPEETENLLARPIEKLMWEVPGVDYVYATGGDGFALVTVRFLVGQDQEESVSKVHAKLAAAMDRAPAGALQPVVKPHSIDDVPILTLTLHSAAYGSDELRQLATHPEDEIRTLTDVAETSVAGGRPRQISVSLDAARLAARGVTPGEVAVALQGSNARLQAGELTTANQVYRVDVGAPLGAAEEVGSVVVSARTGSPVYVRDVARVTDDFGERTSYVVHTARDGKPESAVTVSVAKRKGTAAEKAGELIFHLLVATLSVTLLIWFFLGWREALVVLVAVPVTLGLTLFVYYAMGYTLNRITLFALIFSIGILVDDAIVVVENVYRHLKMGDRSPEVAASHTTTTANHTRTSSWRRRCCRAPRPCRRST